MKEQRSESDDGVADARLLLRPSEAARLLGISRSKCYELIHSGDLPSIRLGGSLRIPVAELRHSLKARLQPAQVD